MKTDKTSINFPPLYRLSYRTEEHGYLYFKVFTNFGAAMDFLNYLSNKEFYLFGQIIAFKRVPDSIGALDIEDEVLYQIYKNGTYIVKK